MKTFDPFKSKVAVIILGSPGAGKSTQAELLSEKFNFYHLETSRIIKDRINSAPTKGFVTIKKKKYFFRDEKKLFDEGLLCSPPFVVHLIKDKIKRVSSEGQSIVFSGSPRTFYEAEELLPFLKKYYSVSHIKIINISLSSAKAIWRNSHRRICSLIGHSIVWNNETKELSRCPLDGSKLIRRPLDKPNIIKVRLREFNKRVLPIMNYFKENGFITKTVNGGQTVDSVFRNILKAIKSWSCSNYLDFVDDSYGIGKN